MSSNSARLVASIVVCVAALCCLRQSAAQGPSEDGNGPSTFWQGAADAPPRHGGLLPPSIFADPGMQTVWDLWSMVELAPDAASEGHSGPTTGTAGGPHDATRPVPGTASGPPHTDAAPSNPLVDAFRRTYEQNWPDAPPTSDRQLMMHYLGDTPSSRALIDRLVGEQSKASEFPEFPKVERGPTEDVAGGSHPAPALRMKEYRIPINASFRFAPDGRTLIGETLASAYVPHHVYIWDLVEKKVRAQLDWMTKPTDKVYVQTLEIMPDGKHFVTLERRDRPGNLPLTTVNLRSLADGQVVKPLLELSDIYEHWYANDPISPDGRYLIANRQQKHGDHLYKDTTCVWNLDTGESHVFASWPAMPSSIPSFRFSRDGTLLAMWFDYVSRADRAEENQDFNMVRLYEFPSGKLRWERSTKRLIPKNVHFINESTIAVDYRKSDAWDHRLLDLRSGEDVRGFSEGVSFVSPDGTWVATGQLTDPERMPVVYDPRTWKIRKDLPLKPSSFVLDVNQAGNLMLQVTLDERAPGLWVTPLRPQASVSAPSEDDGQLPASLADMYADDEEWPAAERSYREAVKANPRVWESHSGLAEALYQQGNHAEALKEYGEATKLFTQQNDGRENDPAVKAQMEALTLGRVNTLIALNNLDEAEKLLATTPESDDADIHGKHAAVRYRLYMALPADQRSDDALYGLGTVMERAVERGYRDKALADKVVAELVRKEEQQFYELAAGIDRDNAALQFQAGQGRTDEAGVMHLRRAVALAPTNSTYLAGLGKAMYDREDPCEAAAAYGEAMHEAPDNKEWRFMYGVSALRASDFSEAEAALLPFAESAPDESLRPAYLAGAFYGDSPEYHEALKPWYRSLPVRYLATAYAKMHQYEQAERWYRKTLEGIPDSADWAGNRSGLTINLARMLRYQNRADEAVKLLSELVEQAAGNDAYHAELAYALKDAGDFPAAEKHLTEAIRLNDSEPEYPFDLGLLHHDLGQFEEALPLLRKAVELDGTDVRYRGQLGKTLVKLNEYEEAEAILRQVTKDAPYDGSYHAAHAEALSGLGRREEALEAARRAENPDASTDGATPASNLPEGDPGNSSPVGVDVAPDEMPVSAEEFSVDRAFEKMKSKFTNWAIRKPVPEIVKDKYDDWYKCGVYCNLKPSELAPMSIKEVLYDFTGLGFEHDGQATGVLRGDVKRQYEVVMSSDPRLPKFKITVVFNTPSGGTVRRDFEYQIRFTGVKTWKDDYETSRAKD